MAKMKTGFNCCLTAGIWTELYSRTLKTHSFWNIVYLRPAETKIVYRKVAMSFSMRHNVQLEEKKCVAIDIILTLRVLRKT